MITQMEVVSARFDATELVLGGFMPNNDPVQVRSIDGLGPVKSEVASTPFATGHGELFQGSSTGKRNIILTLGLNPNWIDQTMMSLRQILYQYFMPEEQTQLKFISDEFPPVYINGVVESFEPNIFSQDPEIQVSIICHKPDFLDFETTLISGTVDEDPPTPTVIDYIGSVPTGFELRIESSSGLPAYLGNLTITNTTRNKPQVFLLENVTVNPTIYISVSTVKTRRHVYNVAVGGDAALDLLAKLDRDSDWPEFYPGENLLSVVADTPGLGWRLGYFNRFGGL